jgi:hypothetical protein
MRRSIFAFLTVGLLAVIISTAFLGCRARMPGDDDPQGTSSPVKQDVKK